MPSFHKDVLFITTYMLVFMLLFTSSKMPLIKEDIHVFILKIQLVIKVPLQNYQTRQRMIFCRFIFTTYNPPV